MLVLNCIGLPDHTSQTIINSLMVSLSNRSGSKKALNFPPHFSVWGDFQIEDNDAKKVITGLDIVFSNYQKFSISLTNYGFYPWKIVYLDIVKTRELQEIHDKAGFVIQKYRTSWIPPQLVNSTNYSKEQRAAIQKYGYQFVGKFYSPHFTLVGNDLSDTIFANLKQELSRKKVHLTASIDKFVLLNRENDTVFHSFAL